MGPAIPHFGAGVCRRQDLGNLLQGGGSGGAAVLIRYMGNYFSHRKDAGGISPLGVPPDDVQTIAERWRRDLEVSPSGCGDSGGSTGGGVDLCSPPPEHGRTVHCDPSNHGPVSW